MGKKKGKKREDDESSEGDWGRGGAAELERFDEEDNDDEGEFGEDSSVEQRTATKIGSVLEALGERRSASREAGLRGLVEMLMVFHVSYSVVLASRADDVEVRFLQCLKRGGTETILAAQALGMVFLSMGPGEHRRSLWARAGSPLVLVASARGADEAASSASAEACWAFAVGCAVCCGEDSEQMERGLDFCGKLAAGGSYDEGFVSAATRLCALRGWRLLAAGEGTALAARRRRGAETVLPAVAALLAAGGDDDKTPGFAAPSLELRSEAGLVAVLLAEDLASDRAQAEVRRRSVALALPGRMKFRQRVLSSSRAILLHACMKGRAVWSAAALTTGEGRGLWRYRGRSRSMAQGGK